MTPADPAVGYLGRRLLVATGRVIPPVVAVAGVMKLLLPGSPVVGAISGGISAVVLQVWQPHPHPHPHPRSVPQSNADWWVVRVLLGIEAVALVCVVMFAAPGWRWAAVSALLLRWLMVLFRRRLRDWTRPEATETANRPAVREDHP